MFNCIISVKSLPNHRVWIEYDDGESGEVDFRQTISLGGVFETLLDQEMFDRVVIGDRGRYLEWPGGIDFCADALRMKLTEHLQTDRVNSSSPP